MMALTQCRFMNDIEAVDLDLPQALENLVTGTRIA